MSKKEAGWPRWRYHKTECPDGKIVQSQEQNNELEKRAKGWVDTPADFGNAETKPVTAGQPSKSLKIEVVPPEKTSEEEPGNQETEKEPLLTSEEAKKLLVSKYGMKKKDLSKLSETEIFEALEAKKAEQAEG
jgi:hypothetical protein